MKTPALVAALVVSFAGSAFAAGEATYDYPQPVAAQKSRADVKAELLQARADGSALVSEVNWPVQSFVAQRSRAEVRAEAIAAMADPAWRELNRESGAFTIAVTPAKAPTMALAK